MKLMGTCQRCGRDLLLDQLLDSDTAMRCPWCGAGMARHYGVLLTRLIPEIEQAGRELTRGLKLLRGDWTGCDLDERSVLGPIERVLRLDVEGSSDRARQLESSPQSARAA